MALRAGSLWHSTSKEKTMMELFRVRTTVKEYRGIENVLFEWFHHGRRGDRPYAELVENYNPEDRFTEYSDPEGAIDELFTAIEAKALKDYIDREYGDESTTTIEKEELPIPNSTRRWGALRSVAE
jgi:hypothetical protein